MGKDSPPVKIEKGGGKVSEPVCYCGHVLDEHDEYHKCTVEDCPCFHFEEDQEAK